MRKIDSIRYLEWLKLPTIPVQEFHYGQYDEIIQTARGIRARYGGFNLRTDANGSFGDDLPFVKDCSIKKLREILDENKGHITYLLYERIDDSKLYCNGVGWLGWDGKFFAEVNYIDKTSNREAMKQTEHLVEITIPPDYDRDPLVQRVRGDLRRQEIFERAVEFSIFDEGREFVYWQIRRAGKLPVFQSSEDVLRNWNARRTQSSRQSSRS